MFEVYTGHKPGRPVLLITIAALALVGALGGAWVQVQNRRALGPQVRLEGVPLLVRAPRGWVRDPEEPSSFILPAYMAWGREMPVVERRITFLYQRLPTLRSPAGSLAAEFPVRFNPADLAPARIGPFDGVQYVRPKQRRRDGGLAGDVIVRRACSPRGDELTVLYFPLTELTHADLGLLDDVCAAVTIDDPDLRLQPGDALARAGLQFAVPADWKVSGPDFQGVAGVRIGGSVECVPGWTLQANRTFLAFDRLPRDVLLDLAAAKWGLGAEDVTIEEKSRADGADVVTILPRVPGLLPLPVFAAIVSQGAEFVLISALAVEPHFAVACDEAVARFVNALQIVSAPGQPVFEAAAEAGRALAARLATPEAFSGAWGMLADQQYYFVTGGAGVEVFTVGRAARNRRAGDGYRGFALQVSDEEEIGLTWRLDADGVGYEWSHDGRIGFGSRAVSVRTQERRREGENTARRSRTIGKAATEATLDLSPAFISLPAEELAEAWVAGQAGNSAAWLIQVSGRETRGLHARLLRPLPPDENGVRRVLSQSDYDPSGQVLAFDNDGRLQYVLQPGWRVERTTREAAQARFPQLGRLIRLLNQ